MALLAAATVAGCAEPNAATGSPLNGLRACPGAGSVIGIFTGLQPTPDRSDGPTVMASDAWALDVRGGVRRLTEDGVHLGGVISPDGREAYVLRNSGRVQGDSPEAPGVIERLDVVDGDVRPLTELSGIVDVAVSGDGSRLAAAHTVGAGLHGVTLLDVDSPGTARTLPRTPGVGADVFSAVTEVALDADGDRVAYALSVEERPGHVVNTLHIRDVARNADSVLHTVQGTDFISDLAWSDDDSTVVAAIRHQERGDTVESPARFRTLRVQVSDRRASFDEGFAQDISPASVDGNRLLGLAPARGEPPGRTLVNWVRNKGITGHEPIDRGASALSVAACSYR